MQCTTGGPLWENWTLFESTITKKCLLHYSTTQVFQRSSIFFHKNSMVTYVNVMLVILMGCLLPSGIQPCTVSMVLSDACGDMSAVLLTVLSKCFFISSSLLL